MQKHTKMRIKKTIASCLLLAFLLSYTSVYAQKKNIREYVHIEIVPDHENWTYNIGEKVNFTIRVIQRNIPLKNIPLQYEIGPEKMKPTLSGQSNMDKGVITINGGTMNTPGFMTCECTVEVDGISYSNYLNIAFNPEKIQPTTTLPDDFKEFWSKALDETRKIPMEPLITLLPEECTPVFNMYHVRLQHYKEDTYIYGKLCIPKKEGKYPAVLRVPGAGVKKNQPETILAEMGLITFSIGIHGIPQTLDTETYKDLHNGVLSNYAFYNLDNKDEYYYKRVYTGCVRALDFLSSLPEYDGENLGVIGGSQGGALAMVTAGLDNRIKALVAFYPALCDLTGYLHNRAGGWPHMFSERWKHLNNKPEKIETSRYYDVVNFARFIEAPGFYSWGYNDATCPPTSFYSAYNVVRAPRKLFVVHETGHWRMPEQDITNQWLYDTLNTGNTVH